jgi:hypothetical protein
MTKKQIHTIIMQEDEIKRLAKRCRSLERTYLEIGRINEHLRRENARLRRIENQLNNVNT